MTTCDSYLKPITIWGILCTETESTGGCLTYYYYFVWSERPVVIDIIYIIVVSIPMVFCIV